MRKSIITFLLAFALIFQAGAQLKYEQTTRLNDGWLFLREDVGNIWELVRPYAKGNSEEVPLWTRVSLPHCFNATDSVDPDVNYYQGPGWYKAQLQIENPYENGRTILHFEGAGQKTQVYVYDEKVGEHVGGYDEWTVDITDAVARFRDKKAAARYKGRVPVSIRCDNTRDVEMMPSDLSDFNVYGGIYRYLNLVYTPAIAFDTVQVDSSVDKEGKQADLNIKALVTAKGGAEGKSSLNIKVYDPKGQLIKEETRELGRYGELASVLSLKIDQPQLWNVDSPVLYSCELTLTSAYGTTTTKETFGFRHFEFVEKGPFILNGKRLLLRGTHRHEDHAGVAAAMTEEMIIREMNMMKEMGVNFIRLGHYQQSRIVLDLCDKLGILVWEEIPWCRGGLGGPVYQEQGKRMLTNMITQHRNHPSVILWGMGNENDWPNDFPKFDKEAIRTYMKELHDLSHQLDDTRLTSIRRCDFCKDIIDVYSPSIWAGWYRGLYTDYKQVSLAEMQRVKRFLHVEWGGDSHAGRHSEQALAGLDKVKSGGKEADERDGDASLYGGSARASKDGDWSESYICDLIDWHLREQETMEWLTGAAYWPFKDFSTPVRPQNPVPYMNQKGVTERDLTPKESYYVFQSYWTEKPMVHIYGHSWPVRWGKPGEAKQIKVYSNCPEVELFLNGKSLGRKKRDSQDFPAAGLRWETPFVAGENNIRAVGMKGGKQIVDEIQMTYEDRPLGKPASIKLDVEPIDDDYAWVGVRLVSKDGVICLTSKEWIRYEAIGDGELIVNQGTSTGSKKVQAFNGQGKIKVKKNKGTTKVAVKVKGLKTAFIDVN